MIFSLLWGLIFLHHVVEKIQCPVSVRYPSSTTKQRNTNVVLVTIFMWICKNFVPCPQQTCFCVIYANSRALYLLLTLSKNVTGSCSMKQCQGAEDSASAEKVWPSNCYGFPIIPLCLWSGRVITPGGILRHVYTVPGGLGSVGLMAGYNDLRGLFKFNWFCDFMINEEACFQIKDSSIFSHPIVLEISIIFF